MERLRSVKTRTLCPLDEQTAGHKPRIAVLGIGNLLLKDEGVGIHLVQKLADTIDCTNVNVIDGGTDPDFISLVDDNIDKLIIIDAARAGEEPGTIYRFSIDDLDSGSFDTVSLHDIGIGESLRMMTILNKQPKSTVIIGVEPKTIDFGLELSPEVDVKMSRIIELVLEEIKETNTFLEVR